MIKFLMVVVMRKNIGRRTFAMFPVPRGYFTIAPRQIPIISLFADSGDFRVLEAANPVYCPESPLYANDRPAYRIFFRISAVRSSMKASSRYFWVSTTKETRAL